MTITKTLSGSDATLALAGRLDTVTSIDLTNEIEKVLSEGAYNLILDFQKLDYISSAGLRVVFMAQKQVTTLGTKLEITGSNENIKEVFNITGFANVIKLK